MDWTDKEEEKEEEEKVLKDMFIDKETFKIHILCSSIGFLFRIACFHHKNRGVHIGGRGGQAPPPRLLVL